LNILGRLNLVKTNSHKVFIAGINAMFSLLVFVAHNKIYWTIGLILAMGNGLGALVGSHFAVSKGERFIRMILTMCVVAMVVKLLVAR
ncbi:MAG: sulfite exporter TauE/SafE family protein, partial [Candidatus Jettenia caeni]|nr:sulfite exporter TauE/SafE family protein [Candidatus Jettenia caeni]